VLVKKGICTHAQKAAAASKYFQPPGIVQFLIIDIPVLEENDEQQPTDLLLLQEEEVNNSNEKEDTTTTFSSSTTISPNEFIITEEVTPVVSSRLLRKHKSSEITVAILLVSYSVGKDLAGYISNNEPEHVKLEGGSRIVLDSAKPPSSRTVVFVWVSLCCLLSACGCFCLTSSMVFELQEQATATPTRPRRRRLTAEQVEANLPLGVFDGTRLVFIREETTTTAGDNEDHGKDSLLAEDTETPTTPAPNPLSLDMCSICLDEYVQGERLRYLPCHHTFHAPCIHKWLTERSATCPLCKIDLYEEEEEEEEPSPAPDLASSWMSMPPEAAANVVGQDPSIPVETRWRFQMQRRGQELGTWGRSIFSFGQRRRNGGENSELVEPLLVAETQEQEQHTPSDDVEEPLVAAEEEALADAPRTESTTGGRSASLETEEIVPSTSQTEPHPGAQGSESQSDETTEVASETV
jgi:hypothetical protein